MHTKLSSAYTYQVTCRTALTRGQKQTISSIEIRYAFNNLLNASQRRWVEPMHSGVKQKIEGALLFFNTCGFTDAHLTLLGLGLIKINDAKANLKLH